MSYRQKIYVGLAVSAGVCTGVALFLYLRHRRQIALSKTPNTNDGSATSSSIFSSLKSRRGRQYNDITSSEIDNTDSESVRFQSNGATIEVDIPGGSTPLTPDQAAVLTGFLDGNNNDIERLHRVLTNIANSATFKESQVNLTNAGCIDRLREILLTTENETTKCKVLLALNNLALNEYTITHFSGIISIVINLCRTTPSKSLVRLYGLNLLVNMSVLEHLHNEYMTDLNKFGLLIESTFDNNDEALSGGKLLVNLSTNKSNLENLLKITGIELPTIVNICTPNKQLINNEDSAKLEDILLRYLTFYCNLAETIINELKQENGKWLYDTTPYQQGAVYFQLFDNDKQMSVKSSLRPQYSSHTINVQIKRLRQAMDTIRHIHFESSVSSLHDEFNENEHTPTIADSSTPKKVPIINEDENSFANLEKDFNEEFGEDETILADKSSTSDQSLASYLSAYSTNDNNTFTSPEKFNST